MITRKNAIDLITTMFGFNAKEAYYLAMVFDEDKPSTVYVGHVDEIRSFSNAQKPTVSAIDRLLLEANSLSDNDVIAVVVIQEENLETGLVDEWYSMVRRYSSTHESHKFIRLSYTPAIGDVVTIDAVRSTPIETDDTFHSVLTCTPEPKVF